jgi:hypothetical protein
MADLDAAKFESEVEKITAQWVSDVANLLKKCGSDIDARAMLLTKKIGALSAPQGKGDEILKRVNEIIDDETRQIKDLVKLKIQFKVDEKSRKLGNLSAMLTGPLAAL